jgi:hypothetical protein
MTARGKNKSFIALLLLLLLINPMLVKSLHRHQDNYRHCGKDLAMGINPEHLHHENCDICSFEYVNVLFIEPNDLEVHLSEIRNIFLPDSGSGHSASLLFASPRAPPVFV